MFKGLEYFCVAKEVKIIPVNGNYKKADCTSRSTYIRENFLMIKDCL